MTGEELKQKGMQQALDNANNTYFLWSDIAYSFLEEFAKNNKVFMIEDVRNAASGLIPDPPSQRAWGGIIQRAKSKLIKHIGYNSVKNPAAHKTPASVWQSLVYVPKTGGEQAKLF